MEKKISQTKFVLKGTENVCEQKLVLIDNRAKYVCNENCSKLNWKSSVQRDKLLCPWPCICGLAL